MNILAERKDVAPTDASEKTLIEFLKEQDMKSTLSPSADMDHALREYIEHHGNLRFMLSEGSSMSPFTALPAEPAPTSERPKTRPVSELSPLTRNQARKAKARRLTPVINAVLVLVAWALMVSFAVQFIAFPLNYSRVTKLLQADF